MKSLDEQGPWLTTVWDVHAELGTERDIYRKNPVETHPDKVQWHKYKNRDPMNDPEVLGHY